METHDDYVKVSGLLRNLWHKALPFRFIIVGGWNFGFSYVFFACAYWLLHPLVHDAIIMVICSIVGITNAFVTHRWLTYRSKGSILLEYFRFYFVYGVQIGSNIVFFLLFVRVLHFNAYLTQAGLTVLLTVLSYWGHKHVSFKGGVEGV